MSPSLEVGQSISDSCLEESVSKLSPARLQLTPPAPIPTLNTITHASKFANESDIQTKVLPLHSGRRQQGPVETLCKEVVGLQGGRVEEFER